MSSMSDPPIVYLDTSDWSRFGDVLRGRGDQRTAALFEDLATIADSGEAVFAFSMPIMAELLQYDPAHHETSLAKVRAVERLCGRTAFLWPGNLLALEVATAIARRDGTPPPPRGALSLDGDWFPSVADAFEDLRHSNQRVMAETVAKASHMNRAFRRQTRSRARRVDMGKINDATAVDFAAMYGIPVADVRTSLVAAMNGSIEPAEAARRLFRAMAKPTAFLETFHVRYREDGDLKTWLSSTGIRLAQGMERSRRSIEGLSLDREARALVTAELQKAAASIARSLVGLAREGALEFALTDEKLETVRDDPVTLGSIPAVRVLRSYLPRFMAANLGIEDGGHHPERSSAGDMVHAFYLPHADVWRGDRRFAHLLRSEVPDMAGRIATRLDEVPQMIAAWRKKVAPTEDP